jgi:hypothetical protein
MGGREPGHLPRAGPAARGRRPARRVVTMEYRALGHSGLRISVLTIGTMTFGGRGGAGTSLVTQAPQAT